MPERGAEIQTLVTEENDQGPIPRRAKDHNTTWWVAPSIGITDQLELALPVEFAWDRVDARNAAHDVLSYGVELQYRFVTADPGRRARLRPRDPRDASSASWSARAMRWVPEVDLIGVVRDRHRPCGRRPRRRRRRSRPTRSTSRRMPGAGVSIETVADLRFGAEVLRRDRARRRRRRRLGSASVRTSRGATAGAGCRRAYGIGVYQIRDAPKLIWGIAF